MAIGTVYAVQGTVTMTQTSGQALRFEPAYASMRTLTILLLGL